MGRMHILFDDTAREQWHGNPAALGMTIHQHLVPTAGRDYRGTVCVVHDELDAKMMRASTAKQLRPSPSQLQSAAIVDITVLRAAYEKLDASDGMDSLGSQLCASITSAILTSCAVRK